MEILNQYGEFSKIEIFNTGMKGGNFLKDEQDGLIIDVDKLLVILDKSTTKDGEKTVKEIMHIFTTDSAIYTTESPTLQETLLDAIDFMGTHKLKFVLRKKRSKNDREFMDVDLVE